MSEATLSVELTELAVKLGINNKTLGYLLPNMSASQIGRLVNASAYQAKYTDEVRLAIMVLTEIDAVGALPCSPKTVYPNILLAFAEKVQTALKYKYTLEELKHDSTWANDLSDDGELPFDDSKRDWDVIGLKNIQSLIKNSINL
ncbi:MULTISPECIES: hypothetical protein [Xenorhabdus]|uniref:hypothetical protein n=1 Tax=Xenorhabdus TaxID=626 RepID=UPI000C052E16|nr:hypothetical protein [Xenorhabdus sp. KK7.4]PHM52120.1 hypothetical protein Xekk_03345 [Xenorhabdus sp. KK7.4]